MPCATPTSSSWPPPWPTSGRPATPATRSRRRTTAGADGAADESAPTVELVRNPDVLAGLVAARGSARSPVIVGFAAETGDGEGSVLDHARAKLARKGCDLLVVNEVGDRHDLRPGRQHGAPAAAGAPTPRPRWARHPSWWWRTPSGTPSCRCSDARAPSRAGPRRASADRGVETCPGSGFASVSSGPLDELPVMTPDGEGPHHESWWGPSVCSGQRRACAFGLRAVSSTASASSTPRARRLAVDRLGLVAGVGALERCVAVRSPSAALPRRRRRIRPRRRRGPGPRRVSSASTDGGLVGRRGVGLVGAPPRPAGRPRPRHRGCRACCARCSAGR